MTPVISIPLVIQAIFLFISSLPFGFGRIVERASSLFLFLSIVGLSIFGLPMKGVDVYILIPLISELLICSILDLDTDRTSKRVKNSSFNELSIVVLFIAISGVSAPAKIALLACSYFVDAYRCASMEKNKESQLSFFTSCMSGLLASALIIFHSESKATMVLLYLLVPLSYYLFPFSILEGKGQRLHYRLGHRVLTILLFTHFDSSIFLSSSLHILLPSVVFMMVLGLLSSNIQRVISNGRLGVEFLILLFVAYFPTIGMSTILPNFFWACVFLCVPYCLTRRLPRFLDSQSVLFIGALVILGVMPGPFSSLYRLLFETARIKGIYTVSIFFASALAVLVTLFFARVVISRATIESESRFGPLNLFIVLSTIIIGVILTI